MSEPEEDQDDNDRDRERQQPRDRVDDQQQAFDDGDPHGDRDPSLAEPAAEAALAMLDHAWFKHGAKLPSGCRQPGLAMVGEKLARLGGSFALGEEAIDSRPRAADVRTERSGFAQLDSSRRRDEVIGR